MHRTHDVLGRLSQPTYQSPTQAWLRLLVDKTVDETGAEYSNAYHNCVGGSERDLNSSRRFITHQFVKQPSKRLTFMLMCPPVVVAGALGNP